MRRQKITPLISIFGEDEKKVNEVSAYLSEAGFTTYSSVNGMDFSRLDNSGIVFLDMETARKTQGLPEILQVIHEASPEASIILMAERIESEDAIYALKNGVFDIILTPFDSDRLQATVKECMGNRRSFTHIMNMSRHLYKANKRLDAQKNMLQQDKSKLEKKMQEHSVIYEISRVTNCYLELGSGLYECMGIISSFLNLESCFVLLFDVSYKKYNYLKGELVGLEGGNSFRKEAMFPSRFSNLLVSEKLFASGGLLEKLETFIMPGGEANKGMQPVWKDKELAMLSLKVNDKLIGKLFLVTKDKEGFILQNNMTFLSILARQVSTLIDRISVYKNIEKERDRLKCWNDDLNLFNDISHAIVSSLDTEQIISIFAERLKKMVSYDALSLLLFDTERVWIFGSSIHHDEIVCNIREDTLRKFSNKKKKGLRLTGSSITFLNIPGINDNCSEIRVPLEVAGTRVGLVRLFRFENNWFDEYQSRLLSMISSPLALALRNAQAHMQVQELARKDCLTNLLNKRSFGTALDAAFLNMQKVNDNLALLMLDVDHFKNVNDRYGHQVGDDALKEVARLILEGIRAVDIAGRYGGEEFAIILPGISKANTIKIAQRIKQNIQNRTLVLGGNQIKLTVSIGISHCPSKHINTAETFLEVADQALYRAKRNGRNRIEWGEAVQESSPSTLETERVKNAFVQTNL